MYVVLKNGETTVVNIIGIFMAMCCDYYMYSDPVPISLLSLDCHEHGEQEC